MDDVVKLLAALGTLIGGIGTTVSVLVVAFRKSNKERDSAAQRGAHLSSVDEKQTQALREILDRLEQLEPSEEQREAYKRLMENGDGE